VRDEQRQTCLADSTAAVEGDDGVITISQAFGQFILQFRPLDILS
jgi:hypothetical protein